MSGSRVRVVSSTALLPLVAEAQSLLRGQVRLEVAAGGSLFALAQLRAGAADVVLADIPAHPGRDRPFVRSPLAVVAHARASRRDLTLGTLKGLLSGALPTWEPVTGQVLPVWPVLRTPGSGTLWTLERALWPEGRPAWSPRAIRVPTAAMVVYAVAGLPGAVGVTELAAVGRYPVWSLEGVPPAAEEVLRGRYPLVLAGYLYARSLHAPGTRRVLRGILQAARGAAARRLGYVPAEP